MLPRCRPKHSFCRKVEWHPEFSIVKRETIPDDIEVTAWTAEGEVMGIRHSELPIEGVQFHPESFLTEHGHQLIQNWLASLPGARAS